MEYEEHTEREDVGLVGCDEGCPAKLNPVTPEEIAIAYTHWRDHSYLSGCSHCR